MKHNVVVIGYGGMGTQHTKLIERVDTLNLKGIYDIKQDRIKAAKENELFAYDTFEDVLADETVELLVIATPNDVHKELSIAGLRAGKNVVCEKPVAMNSQELEDILSVEKETGKHFIVHQNRRWDEDYLCVKHVIDENILEDVFHVECKIHGSRGIPGDWRKLKAHGGGMMLDWGVHLIDRILIMIPEKIKYIWCSSWYVNSSEVEDGFKMHITFESGKTALIEVGTFNYIEMPLWYVLGKNGSMTIDDWKMGGQLVLLKNQNEADAKPIVAGAGLTKTMAPRTDDTIDVYNVPRIDVNYNEFYENVTDVIEDSKEQIVKNHEVMRVMRLMEAAFESAETNQVILFEK